MDEAQVQTGHLDLRDYEVVLADPSYVKALRENVTRPQQQQPQHCEPVDDRPMRQRLKDGVWVWEAYDD